MTRKKSKTSIKQKMKTNHRGPQNQTATNTNGVVIQTGDSSGSKYTVKMSPEPRAQKVAIGEFSNILTWLGRTLLNFLGIDKFKPTLVISGIGAVLSIVLGIFSLDGFKISFPNLYFLFLGIIWLVFTYLIFNLYRVRTCSKCKRKFALKEISKSLLGSAKHRYQIHDNIVSTYKCEFCKRTSKSKYIDPYDQLPFTASD